MAHPKDKIEKLRHDFEKVVAQYTATFLNQFELSENEGWWVGDRIGLDLFCFGDTSAISLDDMVFCIEEGVTYDEFLAHEDYCIKCGEYNLPTMNLQSWHKGAPRIPQSTFDKLDGFKKNLDDAIKDLKEKYY